MSKHEIALLACKILAVYFIAESIVTAGQFTMTIAAMMPPPSFPGMPEADSTFSALSRLQTRMLLGSFVPPIIQLLVGLVLWRIAPAVARRIAADQSESTSRTPGELDR